MNMEGNKSKDILNNTNLEHGWDHYGRDRFILHVYVYEPLILAGVVSNIMAFRTLGRLMRQNVTTFLLRGLAISDISVLLIFGVYLWSGNAIHFHLSPAVMALVLDANPYICSILQIFSMVNVWITVVVGMNRYIALCRPLDATRLCTMSRARKHMIYIVLVSIAVGLPGFFYHKNRQTADGIAYTEPIMSDNKWYFYIYELGCNVILRFLIPFCVLLFFFVRIVIALRASRDQQLGRYGGLQMDRKLTSMLLVLLGVFLVCHVCIWLMLLVVELHDYGLRDFSSVIIYLLYALQLISILIILNSSFNCLIYFVYMKEFRKLLCEKRACPSFASKIKITNFQNLRKTTLKKATMLTGDIETNWPNNSKYNEVTKTSASPTRWHITQHPYSSPMGSGFRFINVTHVHRNILAPKHKGRIFGNISKASWMKI